MNRLRVWVGVFVVASSMVAAASPAVATVKQNPLNLALTGSATQSSIDGGRAPGRAIDGNVSRWDGARSNALTNTEANAWWQVDLGGVQPIEHVKVWTSEFSGLTAFSVFVSDAPFASTDFLTTRNQAGVSEYISTGVVGGVERFTHGGTGRYVRVQLHGVGRLPLSEVEVGGPFNEIVAEPAPSYGVRGLAPSLSTKEDQEVWAIEQIGGTLYVGGRFTEVINRRNAEITHDQPFLAAFNAANGAFIDFWRPSLDGAVFSIEAAADGSRLYVGGEFTNVDGIPHTSGLVALDPRTGHVDPTWRASLEKRFVLGPPVVRNMKIAGGWLYVVGNFTHTTTFPVMTTRTVKNAARFSLGDGEVDNGWKPQVSGGAVWGVDVDTGRNRVYLAGKFTAVNGTSGSAWFHTVNTTNAASVPGLQQIHFIDSQRDQRDVIAVGNRVWVGGAQHYIQMLDATDLTQIEGYLTGIGPPPGGLNGGGDMQDLELVGNRIYATCHCWSDGGSRVWEHGPNGAGGFEAIALDHAWGNLAFDAQTGEYISQFRADVTNFQGVLGGWAIHGGTDGCLWTGGDFNDSSGGGQYPNGLMRQCPENGPGSSPPPITQAPADNTSPTAPTGVTATTKPNQQVQVSWAASSDNDAVAGYLVFRDGKQIVGTAGTKLRYTEIPGEEHTWTVRAIDPSGNLSAVSTPSNPLTVDFRPGEPTTYLNENFAVEDGDFTYADDTFRGTSQPAYAYGEYDPTAGTADGGLAIRIGGVDDDDIVGISGGWSRTFTLAGPTDVELAIMMREEIAPLYDQDEYVDALVSVDGTLRGVSPNDYVHRIFGDCDRQNPQICVRSWTRYVLDLGALSAGTHTVVVGGFNNQKTTETESATITYDEIQVASAAPGIAIASPTDGGVVAGLTTVAVGAEDLADAVGSLDVEVRLDGGPWVPAAWNGSLGRYTAPWDVSALPEGPATVDARATDSDGNTTNAAQATVTVNNINEPPSVTITSPGQGSTVVGTITVRVDATDAEDPAGTLDVIVNVGSGWEAATWNAGNSRYEYVWDTTTGPDGDATVRARATDGNGEQVSATQVVVTVDNIDLAPNIAITSPAAGSVISGTSTVRVNATDAEDAAGSLDVDVDVGAGWQPAVWNATRQRYEYLWDTTAGADGSYTVLARATDSAANVSNASLGLTVENIVDEPPTVKIVAPLSGVVMSGDYRIRVSAFDAEDADGTLTVQVNAGTGWKTAMWKAKIARYEYVLDTTTLPDGPMTLRARATDSGGNVWSASDVTGRVHNAGYAAVVLGDGPVSFWRFNEVKGAMANDSAKGNDQATYSGVNPSSGTLLSDGAPGTGARFDGVDDVVKLPNRKALMKDGPYKRRTVELWFNADDTSGRQVLFEMGGKKNGINVYLDGDTLYGGVWNRTDNDATTPWKDVFLSMGGIDAGQTYHVVLVFTAKGDKVRLYVDGKLVDKHTGVGNLFGTKDKGAVGGVIAYTRFHDGVSTATGYEFDGRIDEVAVYNRVLTTKQIVEHHTIGSGTAPS